MKRLLDLLVATLLLAGCSEGKEDVVISPLFGVCASLNATTDSYSLNQEPVVDWDDGVLNMDGVGVDIYVGRQPDFEKKVRSRNYPVDRRFVLVGQEKGKGAEKLLLAQKRSEETDDFVYVMLSGSQLTAETTRILLQKDFFHSCESPHLK